jgi:phosphoglycolate phosphatase
MKSDIKHVIFDWNGTLLDDLTLAVSCIHDLTREAFNRETTVEIYQALFRFPIREFYSALGFTMGDEDFRLLMTRYLNRFDTQSLSCPMHDGVLEATGLMREAGIRLSVLSASHPAVLDAGLSRRGLRDRFEHVCGLTDGLAVGKLDLARSLQNQLALKPSEVAYVGDTVHDADVAAAIGWRGILFAGGHQTRATLERADVPVIQHLRELPGLIGMRTEARVALGQ